MKWRDSLAQPLPKHPLGFIGMGAVQLLGGGETKLSITQEYPPEMELLRKKTVAKQQNHYVFHKDSMQVQQSIGPILKKRSKTQSPHGSFNPISNKENINSLKSLGAQ